MTGGGPSGSTSRAAAATSGATGAAASPAETTTSATVTSVAVTPAPSTNTRSTAPTPTAVTSTTPTTIRPVTTTIPVTTAPRTTAAPALSPATAATGKVTSKSRTKRICVQTAQRGRRTVCVRYKKLVVPSKLGLGRPAAVVAHAVGPVSRTRSTSTMATRSCSIQSPWC